MLEMVRVLPPVLLRVMACAVLVVPTVWLAKTKEPGVNDAMGAPTAVPLRETIWAEPAALSVKLRVAVRVPVAVGVKETETEQLAAGASDDPQVVGILKSAG